MWSSTPYKRTTEARKLETQLIAVMEKLPADKRTQTLTKSQFDVFLKNIPENSRAKYLKTGIPLQGKKEFIIKCGK